MLIISNLWGGGVIDLPNVSYVEETPIVYYNPYVEKPNSFSGVIDVTDTTIGYHLFNDETLDINNIKLMKVDGVEIEPSEYYEFPTQGTHTYYIEVKESVNTCAGMFQVCYCINNLDMSNWDTSKVTNMGWMFSNCESLTSLDLTNWDISNVDDMNNMFYNCYSLKELRMGGNPTNLNSVTYMFGGSEIMENSSGTFYYNSAYDYSLILGVLPSTWTAVPCTLVDGVLIPNE